MSSSMEPLRAISHSNLRRAIMSFFIVWNFSGNKRALEVMSEREIMKNESVELASGAFETKIEAQAALSTELGQLVQPPSR